MRAANAPAILYVYSQARPPGSSKPNLPPPPPHPCSLMRKIKPKRALITQASMGIGSVIQPILVFSCFCERNSCVNILNACVMQFRLPQKNIPYSISPLPVKDRPIGGYRFARFCPSGCPSVRPSVTLAYPGHISYIN